MGKPSIFSSNYKQQIRRRRLNMFLLVLLIVCAGIVGTSIYCDKNNISIVKALEKNSIAKSMRIPDLITGIKGIFEKEAKDDKESTDPLDANKSDKVSVKKEGTTKETVNNNQGNIGKVDHSTTTPPVNITTKSGTQISNAEFVYLAKNGYKYAVQYKVVDLKIEITGLKEDTNTSEYCISKNKDMIVFDVKQDSSIVLCDSKGEFKMLSREQYKSTSSGKLYNKATVMEYYKGYIWAAKPYFTTDNRVVYVSRIPYFKSSAELYLWSVSLDGKTHKRINSIGNDISKIIYQGYDEKNRLVVSIDSVKKYLDIGSYMLRKYK